MSLPVVVVGGGLSGLSTAYYLSKAFQANNITKKIVLLEASKRFGGFLETKRSENGSLHEFGPRSVLVAMNEMCDNTLKMVYDLNLEKDLIVRKPTEICVKNKYIFANNRLNKLPTSLLSSLSVVPPFTQSFASVYLKMLTKGKLDLDGFEESLNLTEQNDLNDIVKHKKMLSLNKLEDITVDAFSRKLYGNEMANYMFNPLCRGITAGDSNLLSLRSMFFAFFENAKNGNLISTVHNFLNSSKNAKKYKIAKDFISNKGTIWNLRNGMNQLPETLYTYLQNNPNIEVLSQSRLTGLRVNENESVTVKYQGEIDQNELVASYAICALSPSVLSNILKCEQRTNALGTTLQEIKCASVAVVQLEFDGDELLKSYPGFGFLVPSFVHQYILGVTFDSIMFPEHNNNNKITRLTCMLGGDWYDHIVQYEKNESDLIEQCLQFIGQSLNITQSPRNALVRFHHNAIPQPRLGHHLRQSVMKSQIQEQKLPISLVGSAEGKYAVNVCVQMALEASDNYVNSLLVNKY